MLHSLKFCNNLKIEPQTFEKWKNYLTLIISLFLLTQLTLVILYSFYKDTRYSLFYIPDVEKIEIEVNKKFGIYLEKVEKLALEKKLKSNQTQSLHTKKKSPLFCIGVVSVERAHPYLIQTVGSLLDGLDESEKEDIEIIIQYSGRWKKEYDPLKELCKIISPKNHGITGFHSEILHYASMLEECQKIGNYTIIFQDDILVTHNFIHKVKATLENIKKGIIKLDFIQEPILNREVLTIPPEHNWMFIKLFYPEYWSGWETRHAPFMAFSGMFWGFLFRWLIPKLFPKWEPYSNTIFVYFLFFTPFILICIGKQNIFDPFPSEGVFEWTRACCCVGHIYPNDKIPAIVHYLINSINLEKLDFLLDRCAIQFEWKRYLVIPNLVQHMGVYSSLPGKNQGNYYHVKQSRTFKP